MRQQVRFVTHENRVLLFALIQAHDRLGNLAHQVAPEVRWLQLQRQGDLAQQIERREGSEVDIAVEARRLPNEEDEEY
jgi:hypothetical protein